MNIICIKYIIHNYELYKPNEITKNICKKIYYVGKMYYYTQDISV